MSTTQKSKTKNNVVVPNLSGCKPKYRCLLDENVKPLNIVSNKGLKVGDRTYVSRNGEYSGFTVEAQEVIHSIITNNHIERAIISINKKTMRKQL